MKNKDQNIKKELEELGLPLEHKPNMPLSVPTDYFDSFKKDMLEQVSALDFTDQLPNKMPQQVPVGYFEQAKKDILGTILALDHVDQLPKEMPQQVPADYFEQSKKDILGKVLALDYVDQLPKEMPQQVPAGYFEQSKKNILAEIAKNSEGGNNDLQITRSTKRRTWALAASIALIISVGLFFMNSNSSNLNIENELAQIPAEMIDNYINEHQYDFEAFDILENPEIITKDMQSLEEQILNETKTLSNEEIFEYVL